MLHTKIPRGGRPRPLSRFQIGDSELLSYLPSLIDRAIVDHDDFAVDTLAQNQSFETAWKIPAAVIYGHNYR